MEGNYARFNKRLNHNVWLLRFGHGYLKSNNRQHSGNNRCDFLSVQKGLIISLVCVGLMHSVDSSSGLWRTI